VKNYQSSSFVTGQKQATKNILRRLATLNGFWCKDKNVVAAEIIGECQHARQLTYSKDDISIRKSLFFASGGT
jgi:hypothetical protein